LSVGQYREVGELKGETAERFSTGWRFSSEQFSAGRRAFATSVGFLPPAPISVGASTSASLRGIGAGPPEELHSSKSSPVLAKATLGIRDLVAAQAGFCPFRPRIGFSSSPWPARILVSGPEDQNHLGGTSDRIRFMRTPLRTGVPQASDRGWSISSCTV